MIILLAVNGVSAIFGGGALMIDTTGQPIGMLHYLYGGIGLAVLLAGAYFFFYRKAK